MMWTEYRGDLYSRIPLESVIKSFINRYGAEKIGKVTYCAEQWPESGMFWYHPEYFIVWHKD